MIINDSMKSYYTNHPTVIHAESVPGYLRLLNRGDTYEIGYENTPSGFDARASWKTALPREYWLSRAKADTPWRFNGSTWKKQQDGVGVTLEILRPMVHIDFSASCTEVARDTVCESMPPSPDSKTIASYMIDFLVMSTERQPYQPHFPLLPTIDGSGHIPELTQAGVHIAASLGEQSGDDEAIHRAVLRYLASDTISSSQIQTLIHCLGLSQEVVTGSSAAHFFGDMRTHPGALMLSAALFDAAKRSSSHA